MPDQCPGCMRSLTHDLIRHKDMPEGTVVNDAKFEEIDQVFESVLKDLNFRSRHGLAHHVKRVRSWFHFHGPWLPTLPPCAKAEPPKATLALYVWVRDFCDFLAQKNWADEVHVDACAGHRELIRECVALSTR